MATTTITSEARKLPTTTMLGQKRLPLHATLPPLIFGCGTFNPQYNSDPHSMKTTSLIRRALDSGLRAFDTSPFYGPSEALLGRALTDPSTASAYPRSSYTLLTKVGREGYSDFDYSAAWVRKSIARSCERLGTRYLDVVFCHDVEFVSRDEAIGAVRELRRLRDEGVIRYVGVSGYPIPVLVDIAQRVRADSGEPLDIVLSYCNCSLQNTRLADQGVAALLDAGVDVVANASPLAMGLIRTLEVEKAPQGDWHPAPKGLRDAIGEVSRFCGKLGHRIEDVAIRFALETWVKAGAKAGAVVKNAEAIHGVADERRVGVSLIGVSNEAELAKNLDVWRSVLDAMESEGEASFNQGRQGKERERSILKKKENSLIAERAREILREWADATWPSPPPGFVNMRNTRAVNGS